MFTGIICRTAQVVESKAPRDSLALSSPAFAERKPNLGASIAIDGVCLSVARIFDDYGVVEFDIGLETKAVTLLGQKRPGQRVNLEFSLRPSDPMDGHMVQGHIDGLATLRGKNETEGSLVLDFTVDAKFLPLIVTKGSIAINGVSLTVNRVDHRGFSVCLIPITLNLTNLGELHIGDQVHIETDIIGRYLQNLSRFSPVASHA